jgi:acyl transferase domain-containing protein
LLTDLPDDYFWTTVRDPIRFQETIMHLENNGAYRYIDVGPAGTLATFLKYSLSQSSRSTTHAILTTNGRDTENITAITGRQHALDSVFWSHEEGLRER